MLKLLLFVVALLYSHVKLVIADILTVVCNSVDTEILSRKTENN